MLEPGLNSDSFYHNEPKFLLTDVSQILSEASERSPRDKIIKSPPGLNNFKNCRRIQENF